jgi:hypothetical protein
MKKFLAALLFLLPMAARAQTQPPMWTQWPDAWIRWDGGPVTATVGYATIQDEGVALAQQPILNFAGAGVTCTPGAGLTLCTIPGGGAGTTIANDVIWTAAGQLAYATGSAAATVLAAGTANQVLHSGATPSWSAIVNGDITNTTIDLTTKVTGLLPLANLANGSAISVLGRSANSSGVMASITCTAASGNVVRESGSTLGCSAIPVTAPVVNTTGTLSVSSMVASGGSHAAGLAPDPGATAGFSKYLREDATYVNPLFDSQSFYINEEFCLKTSNVYVTGGTGGSSSDLNSPGVGAPCVLQLKTGTTATGQSSIELVGNTDNNNITLGTDSISIQWRVQVPVLSTVGDEYIARIGFCDRITAACAGGNYFEYDRLTSTFWRIVTNNGSTTKATTTNTVTAGQWDVLRIDVNAANNSIAFFINGTQVTGSPLATTLPTNVTLGAQIIKSAGTTERILYLDYAKAYQRVTAAR